MRDESKRPQTTALRAPTFAWAGTPESYSSLSPPTCLELQMPTV